MSIPASYFVNFIPGVIAAGGQAIDLNALVLTSSTRAPVGAVLTFNSATAVAAYFGSGSVQALGAASYFQGPDDSLAKPGALLFYQCNYTSAIHAFLRGAGGLTLAQVNSVASGTIAVTVGGTVFTSSALNLSAAASFSAAATLILAAFTAPTFTVVWDSIAGAFLFTATGAPATSTITFASGAPATTLLLTAATGAVISQGAAIATIPATLSAVVALTTNFASIVTDFEPVTADKITAAAWLTNYLNRYAYVMWDSDATVQTETPDSACAVYGINSQTISGVIPLSDTANGFVNAMAIAGYAASLDFSEQNGRTTLEYTTQSGLIPDVTSGQVASYCNANGYSFYGNANSGNTSLNFFGFVNQSNSAPSVIGSCTGPFGWADSYYNQIQFNNNCQATMLVFFTTIRSVPYNNAGQTSIRLALSGTGGPIQQAINFGTIRTGITLSASQAAEVVALTGVAGAPAAITTNGYYFFIGNPPPTVQGTRGSFVMLLFYTDGQSCNMLNVGSLEIA